MIERLAIILLLAIVVGSAFHAMRLFHMRRMRPALKNGLPTLLYFRGDLCAVCPAQGRYIDQLAEQWEGRLRIERIDAERDPDTAARFSVFTLPTTVLVDNNGRVREVNYGLTDSRKLDRQVSAIIATRPDEKISTPTANSAPSALSVD